MKESYIRDKVLKEVKARGYVCWHPAPPRNVYTLEKDIFGLFDIECWKLGTRNEKLYIQLTTSDHISHRRAKIITSLRQRGIFTENAEVWGYNKKTHTFRIVPITYEEVFPQ